MKAGLVAGIALFALGCGNGGPGDAKGTGATGNNDAGGTDAGGTDAGGTDAGGTGAQPGGGKAGSAPINTPTPKVNDCDGLAAPGVFEEITPPEVKANIDVMVGSVTKGGTFAMAVDPVNQGTVYAGTKFQGVWKPAEPTQHRIWLHRSKRKRAAAAHYRAHAGPGAGLPLCA